MARRSLMRKGRGGGSYQDDRDSGSSETLEPSKSELKRRAHALQQLGVAVSELPAAKRSAIDMPEDLREAIGAYARMTAHGAKKRQMQYVGKLLRGIEPAPLEEAVEAHAAGRAADAARLHGVERWRDRLVHEDEALTDWMNEYPQTDVQHLRSLIRAARKEQAGSSSEQRQPKSFRELFKYIKPLLESDG